MPLPYENNAKGLKTYWPAIRFINISRAFLKDYPSILNNT